MGNWIASYDSTFSTTRSREQQLHWHDRALPLQEHAAVPLFDDTLSWWRGQDQHGLPHPGYAQPGWFSVDVPSTGTTIRVLDVNEQGVMRVRVGTS